jgi:hypothetical protein
MFHSGSADAVVNGKTVRSSGIRGAMVLTLYFRSALDLAIL